MEHLMQFNENEVVEMMRRLAFGRVSNTTFSVKKVKFWGRVYIRIPFGSESPHFQFTVDIAAGDCHDCGVTLGKCHEIGCDAEQCPRCHTQLLSCSCGLRVRAEVTLRSHQTARESRSAKTNPKRRRNCEQWDACQIEFPDS